MVTRQLAIHTLGVIGSDSKLNKVAELVLQPSARGVQNKLFAGELFGPM
jgi:hypothetical protein